jgi:hypothetical protein
MGAAAEIRAPNSAGAARSRPFSAVARSLFPLQSA